MIRGRPQLTWPILGINDDYDLGDGVGDVHVAGVAEVEGVQQGELVHGSLGPPRVHWRGGGGGDGGGGG